MFIISICGGSGSGKTTFTDKVQALTKENVSVIHMDSYYLNKLPQKLVNHEKLNYDHPDAFDWKLLTRHLELLKKGKSIPSPNYDFKTNKRLKSTKVISPTKIILFEGLYSLFNEKIRHISDITVFLHVDADIRFIRRLHRDVEERGRSLDSVVEQYYSTVRPMYQKYLEPQSQFADIIVGEETDVAAQVLAAKINELFQQKLPRLKGTKKR